MNRKIWLGFSILGDPVSKSGKTRESGNTIVSLRLFISGNGYAKLEIALAKGKRQYDKRESIKQKDAKRQMDRMEKYK
jgi:SsrA-binding protein